MTQSVTCVMLADGRDAMVRRAIRSWLRQTYDARYRALLVFDTGVPLVTLADSLSDGALGIFHVHRPEFRGQSIGALRNEANRRTNADIIVHWDSDDWSHPERLTEQVARLNLSAADAVGYREMLFWKHYGDECGEAWRYYNPNSSYCLGTSLCYWQQTWQNKPFLDNSAGGDDTQWIRGMKTIGAAPEVTEPRMIASIHGANTTCHIDNHAEEWRRVPKWDTYCREVMRL